jgi:KEOPS complex subunit Pcc1
MRSQAEIRFKYLSEKNLKTTTKALIPETKSNVTPRSTIKIEREGNELVLKFFAEDTSALRASINSYLRFIYLTKSIIKVIEDMY